MSSTTAVVLPVPGGPCISAMSLAASAREIARCWLRSKCLFRTAHVGGFWTKRGMARPNKTSTRVDEVLDADWAPRKASKVSRSLLYVTCHKHMTGIACSGQALGSVSFSLHPLHLVGLLFRNCSDLMLNLYPLPVHVFSAELRWKIRCEQVHLIGKLIQAQGRIQSVFRHLFNGYHDRRIPHPA